MSDEPSRHNIFFPLTVACGAAFAVTIFAALAAMLGDPRAPVAKFVNEYAGWILGFEAGGVLALGFLAMTVDRRRTLREQREAEEPARGEET